MRVRILKQPRDRYGKSGISQKLAVKDWLNDIRILSNQINKTKLTAAEIRNSEPWIKISNADANEFAAELKNFAKAHKFHISFVSFNFTLKSSFDGGSSEHFDKIARKVGDAELTSGKFSGRYPFPLISDEKITAGNLQNALTKIGLEKIEKEGTWDSHWTTLQLAKEAVEIDEFNKATYTDYIGFLKDIDIAFKAHGKKFDKAFEGAGDGAEFIGKLLGFGFFAALIIGAFLGLSDCSMSSKRPSSSSYGSSSSSGSNSYEYCSSKCKPALMSCTGYRPESQWNICQDEYNQCVQSCK